MSDKLVYHFIGVYVLLFSCKLSLKSTLVVHLCLKKSQFVLVALSFKHHWKEHLKAILKYKFHHPTDFEKADESYRPQLPEHIAVDSSLLATLQLHMQLKLPLLLQRNQPFVSKDSKGSKGYKQYKCPQPRYRLRQKV